MASAVIDFGVGRILSVLENEVLQQTELGDEIESMKQKLIFMKSFLEQHGNRNTNNDAVFTTFIKTTRDLVYQIESIVDEFSYCSSRRHGQSFLKRAAHFPGYLRKRRSILGELKTMNRKIQEMSDSMSTFHHGNSQGVLPPLVHGDDKKWVKDLSVASFLTGDDSLVGIDEPVEKLTGWLLDPKRERVVVTVVGMGGSGKTSLAGSIFRSKRVEKHFDCRTWVTISQSYDTDDVLRAMIRDLYKEQVPTDLSSMTYWELVKIFSNSLREKSYFIVFDDVWSTDFWKLMCVALPGGNHGSRVMITTRSERVANFSYGSTSRVHPVQTLDEDKAWELFCKISFGGPMPPNIEPIARNIVEKCGGLPLGIVALGSMMTTRTSESEWRRVHDNLNWELANSPTLKDIQRILFLSFNDLPYPLKQCFLYCCLFPEDYEIKGKMLIRMWIAHGFVERDVRLKPEEMADSYLAELVCRNLLQVASRNILGRPKVFKMHDMVREVALIVCKDEMFCHIHDDETEETQQEKTRHLYVRKEMSSGMTRRNLHTLVVYCSSEQKIGLPEGLKFLRVLHLFDSEWMSRLLYKLPDSVATLYNLKYLYIDDASFVRLPKSFHRLVNLEVLIVRGLIQVIPNGILKLQNLQYLSSSGSRLCHKASSNFWQLKRLQVLEGVCAETRLIKSLSRMTQLTSISLSEIMKDHGKDLCDSLSKLKDLRSLSLESSGLEEPLLVDALSPSVKIEKLVLHGPQERFPSWIKTLDKLNHFSLQGSRLAEDPIPCIQALPNLVMLSLEDAYRGDTICFSGGFPSLKELKIGNMHQVIEMVIKKGAMPHLQELRMWECRGIKRVPDGIENLTNLQNLLLSGVSEELLESIRGEDSIDRSKVNHIPNIKAHIETENGGYEWENLS